MRTLSEQQQALLRNRSGCTRRVRVLILGPTGFWWDFSALPVGDRPCDFLEEVSVDASLGEPVALARVRLRRQVACASLSPLMAESPLNRLTTDGGYSPLVRSGRPVVVLVGLAPLGQEPGPGDWMELFRGRVDTPRDSGESIEFQARDWAGLLQDTMIELERTYGSATGVPLQSVMQGLLNDNGLSSFGLYTPEDPEWDLGEYVQRKEAVLAALESLAAQAGAGVRYGWSPVADTFTFTLYLPERDATAPAWTYGPAEYSSLPDVELPIEDVRTAVTVWVWDKSDKDAAGQPKKKRVDRQADAALALYGRRWSEMALAATDNIDTLPEAERFADFFLADLAQPPLGVALEVQLHPGLELGDMVRLSPNRVQYSAEQTAAVVQVTHTFSSSGATTRLVLRGKPALAPRVWLSRETGRSGLARTAPYTGPSAPSIVSVQSLPGGLAVNVAPATSGPDTAEYELHVSTTPGFSVDAGNPSTTLKETAARTRFELSGLAAGQAYYGRLVARDAIGNRGPASAQFTLTASFTPAASLPVLSYGVLPFNGHVEVQSSTSAPPDGCELLAGTWGVDAFMESALVYSGGRALRLVRRAAGETRVGFRPFVVEPGDRLAVKGRVRLTLGSGHSLQLRWLDGAFATVGMVDITSNGVLIPSGTWGLLSRVVTVPTGARYARLEVSTGVGSTGSSTYFDSVTADPFLVVVPEWTTLYHPSLPPDFYGSPYETGWAPANTTRPVAWRVNALGEVELRGSMGNMGGAGTVAFYLPAPGVDGAKVTPAGASSSSAPARFRVPAGAMLTAVTTVSVYNDGTGRAAFRVDGDAVNVALDGVRYSTA